MALASRRGPSPVRWARSKTVAGLSPGNRLSASIATGRPVLRSTIGCSTIRGVGRWSTSAWSAAQTRSRPARLASYIARSAAATASDGSVSGFQSAMPAENDWSPGVTRRIFSIRARAWSRVRSGSRTANSSPPYRAST